MLIGIILVALMISLYGIATVQAISWWCSVSNDLNGANARMWKYADDAPVEYED